jgi:nitrogen fixation/metabolism regulation signal transduction histidine kinase
MNWIKLIRTRLQKSTKLSHGDDQQKLMWLVCLVSYMVTASALFFTTMSGYLIAFILIVLALLCVYAVVASNLHSQYQVRTLANLIESMIDGDYSLRGRVHTNRAYQELLNLINNLSETLAKHKIEAKESRLLLERIMEQMDAMVLATDEQGVVVMANASANKLIFGNAEQPDKIQLNSSALGAKIVAAHSGIIEFNVQPSKCEQIEGGQVQGSQVGGEQLTGEHFLVKESFLSEGKWHQLYFLTNAERLLMEKERKAWQSLLRVLSHEMNNSLTPIAAISETIQKKLHKPLDEQNKQSLLEGIGIINERAESLSTFIASYSQLSHLPKPNLSTFELASLLNRISALFPSGNFLLADSCQIDITADKQQFEQVLINLLKNSIEAMSHTDNKLISIDCSLDDKWRYISISDTGSGISNSDNLFVPFYSTKKQGSGIGLALCRQIMFNHNGLIKISNNENEAGVTALLSLPINGN